MITSANHKDHCQHCKKNISILLSTIFGEVQPEYDIDLPSQIDDYKNTNIYSSIYPIYKSLQNYRGHCAFVKARKLSKVDFFIPKEKIIIEIDESQHFTKPREIALSLYPKNDQFRFSIEKWKTLCRELNKRDNSPSFRDEQRAWYDTLRDFAPIFWGDGKVIRLYSREFAWCSLNHKNESDLEKFRSILSL